MCTPGRIPSPVTCVAGNCSTHCATAAVNVHSSRQHIISHSSLITIAQNNCVAALYCVPVVLLTLCPPAFAFVNFYSGCWLVREDILTTAWTGLHVLLVHWTRQKQHKGHSRNHRSPHKMCSSYPNTKPKGLNGCKVPMGQFHHPLWYSRETAQWPRS